MNALEIAEIDANTASGDHRQAEASVAEKSATLKSKMKDLKGILFDLSLQGYWHFSDAERQMDNAFEEKEMTLEEAIKDAFAQLNFAKELVPFDIAWLAHPFIMVTGRYTLVQGQ